MKEGSKNANAPQNALLRWRMVLGKKAEEAGENLALEGLQSAWSGGPGTLSLTGLDHTLGFVYDQGERSAGLGASAVYLPKWLGDLRSFFGPDNVALVQKDAIDRKGLKQLLLEPETLVMLEKNVDLAATLVAMKDLVPDNVKQTAREIIQEVVEGIKKNLVNEIRQAVVGALKRNRHSPLPLAANIDWKRTIGRNLKNYDRERGVMIPERFFFWSNELQRREWSIIILVDQSGSMGTSVIYSSIMAAIFASLGALKTHLVFFDTQIVDVTHLLADPVDVIFGAQLGGGTDIARAAAYGATLVERPDRTIFVLITDLYEGGNPEALLRTFDHLVESKALCLCLLALTEGGRVAYDSNLAGKMAALGVHTFASTPKLLIEVMERILKGLPFNDLVRSNEPASTAGRGVR